ncbi:hypothetical protein CPC08DRAFT_674423 [Agrocybe pediades]|nr:hypothetical protein CPC08DRAFT_674423 [Agrocybe pediades]
MLSTLRFVRSLASPNPTTSTMFETLGLICLATITGCAWASMRPNVADLNENKREILMRRLGIMICFLLVPETMILSASRQWLRASRMAKRYSDKGWTTTHGFFALMGGFSLYKHGRFVRVLDVAEIKELEAAGEIEWPAITTQQITEQVHSNRSIRIIIWVQAGLFLVHTSARLLQNKAITQLEVITMAVMVMAAIMNIIWWDKPLDVQTSFPIHLKAENYERKDLNEVNSRPAHAVRLSSPADPQQRPAIIVSSVRLIPETLIDCINQPGLAISAMEGCESSDQHPNDVPTFSSPECEGDPMFSHIVLFLASSIQCLLHLVAWYACPFSTAHERRLWLTSSIIIPLFHVVTIPIGTLHRLVDGRSGYGWTLAQGLITACAGAVFLFGVFARLNLLILPFSALLSLPPESYEAVEWSSLLPRMHVVVEFI